jgi:hypothetical protein
MRRHFDLGSYEDVSAYADRILQRLRAGTMPCDGPGRLSESRVSTVGFVAASCRDEDWEGVILLPLEAGARDTAWPNHPIGVPGLSPYQTYLSRIGGILRPPFRSGSPDIGACGLTEYLTRIPVLTSHASSMPGK